MSMLVQPDSYTPSSSVYSHELPDMAPLESRPNAMLLPPEQSQQDELNGPGMQMAEQYMSQLGAGGGAGTASMGLPGTAGMSAMASPGVAGAMPGAGIGGGSVAGGMSVPGMSVTGATTAGGVSAAGGSGAMGALANPLMLIPVAVGLAGHYQEKQGINTWGEHLTDFGGSHVRHGEELDRLSGKFLGENSWVGDNLGKMLQGPMRISSLRPREMWGGVRDTLSPITSIADLWS